jgi:glycosyltransferase 2 family protein
MAELGNTSDTENRMPLYRRLVLSIIFGFVVLLGLVLVGDIRQVSGRVLSFRWELFPVVLVLTLFNYTLRFFKWHFYLKQMGVRGFPIRESARLFLAGFPLAMTPGKVGEALKAVWLQRLTGLSVPRGIVVVLAERISDGFAVLVLSSLGVIAYPRYWPAFALVLIALFAFVLLTQARPVALALLRMGERIRFLARFAHSLRDFYEGSYILFRPWTTLVAVGLGTVSWFAEGIGFYLILLGLGLPPGPETFSIAVFVLAFSTVVGAASTLPGGLGAAEASIAGMLVLLLTVSTDLAASATLLIRFGTLWFGVTLGLIVWGFSKHYFNFGNAGQPHLADSQNKPGCFPDGGENMRES